MQRSYWKTDFLCKLPEYCNSITKLKVVASHKVFPLVCFCVLIAGCSIERRRHLPGYHVEMHKGRFLKMFQANQTDLAITAKQPTATKTIQYKTENAGLPKNRCLELTQPMINYRNVIRSLDLNYGEKADFVFVQDADSLKKPPRSAVQIAAISVASGAAFAANQMILDAVFRSIANTTGIGLFNGLGVFSLGLSAITVTLILSTAVMLGILIFLLLENRKRSGEKSGR